MRNKAWLVVLIFILSFGLTLTWVLGAQASSGVAASPNSELHVCPSGCPYDNVQNAVDAANEGDFIKVAEGTYTGVSEREDVTQTVYLSKTLTIQGGYTTSNWITPYPEVNITKLDAQGQGRVLYINGHLSPLIAGLHITGGNAIGREPSQQGGGVYMNADWNWDEEPTVFKNNHIYGNTALEGGGVFNAGRGANYDENTFSSNIAQMAGGGLAGRWGLHIMRNSFEGNSASLGGGLAILWGDAVLQGNTFTSNNAGDSGGGLFVYDSNLESEADSFISNSAQHGGGLAIIRDPYQQSWIYVELVNTLIANNQASVEGSGIYISGILLHLWHATLVSNTGGDGSGFVIGNYNPWSEANTSTVDLRDTIVVSQTIGIRVEDNSKLDIDSILWYADAFTVTEVAEADVSLVNQLTGDPDFADPVNLNFHIGPASAARDTGMLSGTPADIDGMVRPMGFGYDLGAYEHADSALSLNKTPNLSGANVGAEITYQLVLTSSGAQDNNNIVLTDTLDAWQRATSVDSALGNCIIEDSNWGGMVVCEPGNLNIGDVIEIALTAEVSATTPIGQAMTNTLTAQADKAANRIQSVVYAQDCHVRIGNAATEYTSVQAAVDAAYPTALVKVAGTCMGVYGPEGTRQQVYLDKSVTIQGGYSTSNWTTQDPEINLTTLDARGLGRVFYILGDYGLNTVTIDGFDITGGNAYGQIGDHEPTGRNGSGGGGIYMYGGNELITLSNNHFFNNVAGGGGGLMTSFCSGVNISGDIFTTNQAGSGGGGYYLHAGGVNLTDVIFDSNITDGNGGGIDVVAGNAHIVRGKFINNHAGGIGGAMRAEMGWDISESLLLSNTAKFGGGVGVADFSNWASYTTIINTVIADNHASAEGAGIFIPSNQTLYLLQTTLARNTGGDGSGITLGWYDWMSPGTSTVAMTDTILAYQSVGIRVTDASTVTMNGVLWHADPITLTQAYSATVWVQNQHSGNPAFLAPDAGDYHIGETSAARDMGVPSGVRIDIDGEPRPYGAGWDLGADEFFISSYPIYLPLAVRH